MAILMPAACNRHPRGKVNALPGIDRGAPSTEDEASEITSPHVELQLRHLSYKT